MTDKASASLYFEGFELVPLRRVLKGPKGDVDLRPKSLDVLIYLANAAGRVVPKEELLDAVWPDVTVSDESLERCVSDIRAALSDDGRKILKTVSRRGYLFASELKTAREPAEQAPGAPESTKRRSFGRKAVAAGLAMLIAIAAVVYQLWQEPRGDGAPLVAILPLVDAAAAADTGYFADGLTEDLSLALARFKSLNVVAPASAAKFKDSVEAIADIGQKLGARFLLTGSIRRSADTIVLSLRLADTTRAEQVWSGQYDGRQDGFIGAKAAMVGTIATILDKQITRVELDRIARKQSLDMTAYDLVLQGNALIRNLHSDMRGDGIAAARALYERAATIDPRYADAVEGIANTYLLAWLEPSPNSPLDAEFQSPNVLKWSGDYARKAVELDETSASARATLGWILNWQSGPTEGLASYDQALELNPGLADWRYGLLLSHGGRAEDAEVYMKRIMLVDPIHPPRYKYLLGKAYYFQGRYEEALPLIRQAAAEMPSHRPSHVLLTAVSAEMGLKDAIPTLVRDVYRLEPKFTISSWLDYIRISDEAYAARLRGGLQAAGLPEG